MIVRLAQVKALLQITSTTYDTLIQTLIPIIEDDVIRYCNTAWQDRYIYRESGGSIAFVKGDPDTITDSESLFVAYGFADDMDIYVEGASGTNQGVHTIASAKSGVLDLTTSNQIINQDPDDTNAHAMGAVRISRINWPTGIQWPAAQMIKFRVDNPTPNDAVMEKIDDYLIQYPGGGNLSGSRGGYPSQIFDDLRKFRRVIAA